VLAPHCSQFTPAAHWMGDWVVPTASLDVVAKEGITVSAGNPNTRL